VIRANGDLQPFPAQSGIKYNDQAYSILAAASEAVMDKAAAGIFTK